MAAGLFDAKLAELQEQMTHLGERLENLERLDPEQLQKETQALREKCGTSEQEMGQRLSTSRADVVQILGSTYAGIGQLLCKLDGNLQEHFAGEKDPGETADEKTLLAEYSLDFALLAADRALLLSMEAMEAQNGID